jgi:hypothetical protein
MEPESNNTKKIVIAGIFVACIVFAMYFFFFRSSAKPVLTLDEFGNPAQAQVVGQDLIDLLVELQAVQFQTAVFSSPLFQNLNDFSIQLRDEPRGRSDPFAPLGGGAR